MPIMSEKCAKKIPSTMLNVITAWSWVQPKTIVKCFKQCGMPSNSAIVEDFNELNDIELDPEIGDMPWDDFMQWESELEAADPCIEPNGVTCDTWKPTPLDAKENAPSQLESPPPTINETMKCIHGVDDSELFKLINLLCTKLQSRKTKTQITKNNKQTNITAFFNRGSD